MILFWIAGDAVHTFALLLLPVSIILRNSYGGVSHRTQLLLSMVFITRYMDLFLYFEFKSYYHVMLEILFILTTSITFLMGYRWKDIDKKDTFKGEVLVFGALVTTIFNAHTIESTEIFWVFSEYLESVAIVPQVYLILNTKRITKAMALYMLSMGVYITFYFFNWMHRYNSERYFDAIADVSSMIFIGIYAAASLLMVCCGVKFSSDGKGRKGRSSLLSGVTIFSISSHLVKDGGESDCAPLVNDKELDRTEKGILEGF